MDALILKVEKLFARKFPGAKMRLKRYRRGGPVGGVVAWKGFDGQEQIDRQISLRDAIRRNLPATEQAKVSFILTVTPHEDAAMEKSAG
jgi:hypothetical protein